MTANGSSAGCRKGADHSGGNRGAKYSSQPAAHV